MSAGNFRNKNGAFGDVLHGIMEQGSYQFSGPLSMQITVAFRAWDAGACVLGFPISELQCKGQLQALERSGSNLEPGLHP